MAAVIFDIETVGQDFESLDETSKEYFLRFAKTDEEVLLAKDSLSFFPLTAQVVTIGMLEAETNAGFVYFQNNNGPAEKFTENNCAFISGSEKEILANFWTQMKKYNQFVTFNGRVFDCPFLMLRSGINKIRPTKNLVPYRYAHSLHVDLYDQLSFYDALKRKFGLHMWCQAFGIKSPKEEGVTGLQVKSMYKDGRYHDIARYCARDLYATRELFRYWDKYLKFA